MNNPFYNENLAFPRTINFGAKDESKGELTIEDAPLTYHVPLIYIMSDRGRLEKTYCKAGEAFAVYGKLFADERSEFFKHPSELFNILRDSMKSGSSTFAIKRIIPSDAKVKSNLRMYLDIVRAKVPNYKRNSDGSYALDAQGKKILDADIQAIDGHVVRWTTKADKDANIDKGEAKVVVDGNIEVWDMPEGGLGEVIHVTKARADQFDIGYAGKTVYVYADEAAMFNPIKGVTKRTIHKLVLNTAGTAVEQDNTVATVEQTFGDPDTFLRSKSYPMFEAIAVQVGSGYDNVGFSIESVDGEDLKADHIRSSLHLPYKFTMYTRKDPLSKPEVLENLDYNRSVMATFKAGDFDPETDLTMDVEELFPYSWYNEKEPGKTKRYAEMDSFHIYRENIAEVLGMISALELPYITKQQQEWVDKSLSDTMSWTDFVDDATIPLTDQINLLNIINFRYAKGANLITVEVAKSRMPEDTEFLERDMNLIPTMFLENGQDGTLSNQEFEDAIMSDLKRYANIDDVEYQNLGTNHETIIWDTGFSMDCKEELVNFISVRKGTSIVGSTFVYGETPTEFDFQRHLARAEKLKNAFTLYPESELYGTPAARAAIWIGYGRLPGKGRKYLPLTLELAIKINKYIGPVNGYWDDSKVISLKENKRFGEMYDIQPSNLSNGQQMKLDKSGTNYPLTGTGNIPFIPAFKTVYGDATSGLYSFITTQGLTVLDKVQYAIWEMFTGTSGSETNAALLKRIQEAANTKIAGVTGSSLDIRCIADMTEADKKRGFSWRLRGELRSATMKTVQLYNTVIMRIAEEE